MQGLNRKRKKVTYIKIEQVHKSYGDNHVLKDINIQIQKGQLVTLLGPSGCGKSTLLRCMAGLEDIQKGAIYLEGKEISKIPAGKRNIGMVFQQYSLFPQSDSGTKHWIWTYHAEMKKDVIQEKIKKVITLVELEGKESEYPASLSGGQQQRVALARSIIMEPKVLLLDEPLSAIDAKLRKSLQQKIMEIQKELNLTVVFVTHDQDEAMLLSDVIWLFNRENRTKWISLLKSTPEAGNSFCGQFHWEL